MLKGCYSNVTRALGRCFLCFEEKHYKNVREVLLFFLFMHTICDIASLHLFLEMCYSSVQERGNTSVTEGLF